MSENEKDSLELKNLPQSTLIPITGLRSNPNNPRIIKDDKFKKLSKSLKDAPWMLKIRPIVVDADMRILGGNMRFKAAKEAGLKQVPIIIAEGLTDEQKKEFIVKDNVGFGEWDWEILGEWDSAKLLDWGLEVWNFDEDLDYSILNDDDSVDSKIDEMQNGVKKAIQIEFEPEHYEEAQGLVKYWRERDAYIGSMLIEALKSERDK